MLQTHKPTEGEAMLKNLLKAIAKGVLFAICWWTVLALYHCLLDALRPVSLHAFWQGFIFAPLFLLCLLPYYAVEGKLNLSTPKSKTWPERIAYFNFYLGAIGGSVYLFRIALPQVRLAMPQPSWPDIAGLFWGFLSLMVLLFVALVTYEKLRLRAQK